MAAYADPRPLLEAFTVAARRAIAPGRDRDRARRGSAQRLPRRPGRLPGRRRTGARLARHAASRWPSCGPRSTARPAYVPSRLGFHGAQPPRDLLDAARGFYGVTGRSTLTDLSVNADVEVDVAVVGRRRVRRDDGAAGLARTRGPRGRRASRRATREGCNAAISSGSPGGRGHPLPAGGRHRRLPAAARRGHPRRERRRGAGDRSSTALCAVAPDYVEWIADELGYPIETRRSTCRAPACRCRGCTPTSAGWVADR